MGESIPYNCDVPPGWTIIDFGTACDKISLNGIKIKQKEYLTEGSYPVVDQGQELIGGRFDKEVFLVPLNPPYIVFGDHTKAKKYINFRFIAGADGVIVLKARGFYDPRLLFYFLHVIKLPDKGYARHFQFLQKSDIPLPPIPEQHRIVAKIEELFSELEKGVEVLKTVQQQLKVYRQAVLKWAFEGKLTNENVVDGELPKGWKNEELGALFLESPQNGVYRPATDYGSGTRIIRIDGFNDGRVLTDYQYKRVRLTQAEIAKYNVSVGNILVNRVNSLSHLGKCGYVEHLQEDTVFESNIMRIIVNPTVAKAKYISIYLSSQKGLSELRKNAKHAVNQASINQKDVSDVLIPLASLPEQHAIVSEIESRLSVADKIEETINNALKQAEFLRQSILKKAFEGKLVPQNPNDEPAARLLECIKAEKAAQGPVQKTRKKKATI